LLLDQYSLYEQVVCNNFKVDAQNGFTELQRIDYKNCNNNKVESLTFE